MINNYISIFIPLKERSRSHSEINKGFLMERANEISKLLTHYFDKNTTHGTYDDSRIVNKAAEFIAKKTMLHSTLVTSLVLPYMRAFSGIAEGISPPAAISLVAALYCRLLTTGEYELENLPPPDQLIQYDREKGAFIDPMGEKMNQQEVTDLQLLIQEFDLILRILTAKDEITDLIFDDIKAALQNFNTLEHLVKYSVRPFNQTRVINGQILYSIMEEVDALSKKLIISENSKLYFDDASKSLFIPSNWISANWYYQPPEIIIDKVSKLMKPELLAHCEKMKQLVDKLTEISISNEGFEAIDLKISRIADTLTYLRIKANETRNHSLIKSILYLSTKVLGCLEESKIKLQKLGYPSL